MRSFASLARTLNLSETVRELRSTRQTVRRHISLLEEMKGAPLFRVENRRYFLTEIGEHSLREAEELIARGLAWLNNESGHYGGLFHLNVTDPTGYPYFLQQHPMGRVWSSASPLLSFGAKHWAMARGQIEHEDFAPLRPHLLIFRKLENDWICIEIGDQSSYASWYSWEWKRSSVGRGVADLPGGRDLANLLSQPFQDTMVTQGLRLDHVHTRLTRGEDTLVPISFERLLMGVTFPDGSPAIAALINRTYDISIEGMPQGTAQAMPEELIMDFEPPTR